MMNSITQLDNLTHVQLETHDDKIVMADLELDQGTGTLKVGTRVFGMLDAANLQTPGLTIQKEGGYGKPCFIDVKPAGVYCLRYLNFRWYRVLDVPGPPPGKSDLFKAVTADWACESQPAILGEMDADWLKEPFLRTDAGFRFGPFHFLDGDGIVRFGIADEFAPGDEIDIDSPVGRAVRRAGSDIVQVQIPKDDNSHLPSDSTSDGIVNRYVKYHEGRWRVLAFTRISLKRRLMVQPNTVVRLPVRSKSEPTAEYDIWFGPAVRRRAIYQVGEFVLAVLLICFMITINIIGKTDSQSDHGPKESTTTGSVSSARSSISVRSSDHHPRVMIGED